MRMLITTHTGLVVNSDHVAYIALKKHSIEDREAQASGDSTPRFKVLLYLAEGDAVVAAALLTQEAATFLRQDIANSWTDGSPSFDVNHSLRRHLEGAYFASEAEESTGKERR
jgi:hypothetical protein